MKTMKTCKYGCGKMAAGGVAKMKKVKKMAKGGAIDKPQIYGIPQTGTTNYSAPTMKKGGPVRLKKKMAKGGSAFGMLSVKAGFDSNPGKTAADRIAGAKLKMRMGKKK
jgi:hypothetical protein